MPQAVIGQPISSIGEAARLPLLKGHDHLDEFEGLALLLDDSVPFTILHYRGHRRAPAGCICRSRWVTRGASAR